jgi:hypothetical protein
MKFKHHNNCPNCPIVGAEDIAGDERFRFLALEVDVAKAKQLVQGRPTMLLSVEFLRKVQSMVRINPNHLDHIPNYTEPGILMHLPGTLGSLLVDGNHRAARALRDGREYEVRVIETYELTKVGVDPALVKRLEREA